MLDLSHELVLQSLWLYHILCIPLTDYETARFFHLSSKWGDIMSPAPVPKNGDISCFL